MTCASASSSAIFPISSRPGSGRPATSASTTTSPSSPRPSRVTWPSRRCATPRPFSPRPISMTVSSSCRASRRPSAPGWTASREVEVALIADLVRDFGPELGRTNPGAGGRGARVRHHRRGHRRLGAGLPAGALRARLPPRARAGAAHHRPRRRGRRRGEHLGRGERAWRWSASATVRAPMRTRACWTTWPSGASPSKCARFPTCAPA